MPRRSLFARYFMIFFLCFFVSILILGVVLIVAETQYFKEEKYNLLESNAYRAATITNENLANNGYRALDKNVLETTYYIFASAIDAEIFLTDSDGVPMLGWGTSWDSFSNMVVPEDAVEKALQGKYESVGTLNGFFEEPHYIVGVPVLVGESKVLGIMFAASSAKGLNDTMQAQIRMIFFGASVVLFIAFVALYFVTYRLVRPMRDMLSAIQSFSAGDFSKRVPISSYDEIGQLAMAFNNMATSLAATESTRRSFIANVSHELKTPMTTISGFVDGILDGTVPEEKQHQYLQVVSNEVKRLSRLVRSMLDTARIETGEMEVRPTLFDISETIRTTVFSFEQSLEEKQVELRGLEIDKVMVYADVDLMHQVVYNLVENAVKFVSEGGYIEFRYQTVNQGIYVAIRNSGEGLDKEEAPKLFERFYKSDKSRSLNKDGVGLGLHIVKSIINYHNGEIVVRTVKGEYTEFEFFIPVQNKKGRDA